MVKIRSYEGYLIDSTRLRAAATLVALGVLASGCSGGESGERVRSASTIEQVEDSTSPAVVEATVTPDVELPTAEPAVEIPTSAPGQGTNTASSPMSLEEIQAMSFEEFATQVTDLAPEEIEQLEAPEWAEYREYLQIFASKEQAETMNNSLNEWRRFVRDLITSNESTIIVADLDVPLAFSKSGWVGDRFVLQNPSLPDEVDAIAIEVSNPNDPGKRLDFEIDEGLEEDWQAIIVVKFLTSFEEGRAFTIYGSNRPEGADLGWTTDEQRQETRDMIKFSPDKLGHRVSYGGLLYDNVDGSTDSGFILAPGPEDGIAKHHYGSGCQADTLCPEVLDITNDDIRELLEYVSSSE